MTHSHTVRSATADVTHKLGYLVGQLLPARAIITLVGPLGAGKTTFVQGVVKARTDDQVTSPTFVYHQRYGTSDAPVDHIDLYRLQTTPDELAKTGVLELLEDVPGWLIIEWPLETLPYPNDVTRLSITAAGQPDYAFQLETDDSALAERLREII